MVVLDSGHAGALELEENKMALLQAWLEDRYLNDSGFPDFAIPDQVDLRTIVRQLDRVALVKA